jgi:hypothetical protein
MSEMVNDVPSIKGDLPSNLNPGQFSFLTEHPIDRALGWHRRLKSYAGVARGTPHNGLEVAQANLFNAPAPRMGSNDNDEEA